MNRRDENDEMEIDLLQIFRVILAKIWMILIVGAVIGILAFAGTKLLITPMYQATAKLYIINRQNSNTTTYNDLISSTQIVKDYQVLVKSQPVVSQVLTNLNIDMSEEALIGEITCAIESDSRVLSITVTDADPYMAKKFVDQIADVSSEQITSVMKIEGVSIIEYGKVPSSPSSPNVYRNTLIGLLAGIIVSMAYVVIKFMVDDTIKSSEDMEKYLGISTLALIPITEAEYDGKQERKSRSIRQTRKRKRG